MGVRKDTPKRPYFFHIPTNRLFFLVNFFLFRLNMAGRLFLNLLLVKIITLVIIPATVISTVSPQDNPDAGPMVGPAMNLTMLKR